MLFTGIPRVRLLHHVTPLERLARLEAEKNHSGIYAKRDDCMPLGLGGNKVRSLEFWMGQALAEKCDVVVVAGAKESNQCRLTAAAAAKLGLKCHILHSSDEPADWDGNLLLNDLLGSDIRFLGPVSEEERGEIARHEMKRLASEGHRPYLVGDPVLGALGYVVAALELHHQADAMEADLLHVVLPGSMGPTEAGFLFGMAMLGAPFFVHLVSVEYGKTELLRRIEAIFEGVEKKLGFSPSVDFRDFMTIYEEYLGDGYGKVTPASLEGGRLLASIEGIFLENTYTSKTFAGMMDLLGRGAISRNEAVCFLHTGGIPALFGQSVLFTERRKRPS